MRIHAGLLGVGYTAADLAFTTDPAMLAKLTLQEDINAGRVSLVQATANAGGVIDPCGNPEFAAANPNYPNFRVPPSSCNTKPGPLQVGQSNAPAANVGGAPPGAPPTPISTVTPPAPFDLVTWFKTTSIGSIPNWAFVVGGLAIGGFFLMRSK